MTQGILEISYTDHFTNYEIRTVISQHIRRPDHSEEEKTAMVWAHDTTNQAQRRNTPSNAPGGSRHGMFWKHQMLVAKLFVTSLERSTVNPYNAMRVDQDVCEDKCDTIVHILDCY